MEQEALAFHHAVRQGYLDLARREPERFHTLDGTRSIEALQAEIYQLVCQRMPPPA
jgi:dTMP kinase